MSQQRDAAPPEASAPVTPIVHLSCGANCVIKWRGTIQVWPPRHRVKSVLDLGRVQKTGEAFACTKEVFVPATTDPEQMELLIRDLRMGSKGPEACRKIRWPHSRGEAAHIAE
jgi:hypothetical protein